MIQSKLTSRYVILALLVFSTTSFAQDKSQLPSDVIYDSTYHVRIHSSLPEYSIHFHITAGKNIDGEIANLYSITTYSSADGKMLDSVFYSKKDFDADDLRYVLSSPKRAEAKPHFIDKNNDGYLDIRMVSSKYDYYEFLYDYLIYNPQQKKFCLVDE